MFSLRPAIARFFNRAFDELGAFDMRDNVADRRKLTRKPPNLDVAVTADVPEFLNRLVERVGGLAAARST